MEDIKLSVIVPVYNMEQYIDRCLKSVTTNILPQMEVIIVDDGSTDRSTEISSKYVDSDSKIRMIRKKNGGLISARKEGLRYAKGEYITFVDSDDWIDNTVYEEMILIIDQYQPDMIAYPFVKDYKESKVVKRNKLKAGLYGRRELDFELKNLGELPFFTQLVNDSLCTKVIKKGFIEPYYEDIPIDITIGEDTAIVVPALLNLSLIYVSDTAYYHYVQNHQSMSWNKNGSTFKKLKLLEKHMKKYLTDGYYERNQYIINAIFYSYMMIIYDWPDTCFEKGLFFLPKINQKSRLVIYGKGVFASNLIDVITRLQLAEIVMNVDSNDSQNLFNCSNNKYDYIVIAVLDALIVENIILYLQNNGVDDSKIMIIEKACLINDNLPQ